MTSAADGANRRTGTADGPGAADTGIRADATAASSPAAGESRGRHRRFRFGSWLPIVAAAVVAILAWKLLVVVANYPAFVLPAPDVVFTRLIRAWQDGIIQPELAATLTEICLGFVVGGTIALILGTILARSRVVEVVLSPYLVAAQTMPILAIAPLITLWFGSGLSSKVIICGLIVFFPIVVATMVGFRRIDPALVEMARSFRASRRDILVTIEIPAALPVIFGGIRVGVTLSVVGAIVAEWSGADHGLGVLINLARGSLFDTPLLFATLLTIALVGIALYVLVSFVERLVVGSYT
jgi:NitT/TauT family transport system permease protein